MYKVADLKSKNDDEFNAWKMLKVHNIVPVNKFIVNIDVDINEPLRYSVVTDTEIPVFSCSNNSKFGNLGNFKNATCCKFRGDGEMVIVGTKTGQILLIPMVKMGNIIRKMAVHNGSINKVEYLHKFDLVQKETASIGDDGSLQICDIIDQKVLFNFSDSKEPLKSLAVHKKEYGVIATGSMDGNIRLYNIETSTSMLMSINTQMSVNCLSFPWDSRIDILLSAGNSSLQLWNASDLHVDSENHHMAVQTTTPHHMNIMDMSVTDGLYSGEKVVFTAGLDGLVKVISLGDFREIFKYEYPSNLMAIRVLPHSQYLIVAGNDIGTNTKGHIYTRRLHTSADDIENKQPSKLQRCQGIEHQKILSLANKYNEPNKTITVIEHVSKTKLSQFDKLIKKHKHRAALTMVIKSIATNNSPEYWQKVIRELDCLRALSASVAKRSPEDLTILFRTMKKYIWIPRFTRTFLRLLNVIISIYPFKEIEGIREFAHLRLVMKKSVAFSKKFDQTIVTIKDLLRISEGNPPNTFAKIDCTFPVLNGMEKIE